MWDFNGMYNALPIYPPPTGGAGPLYMEMPVPSSYSSSAGPLMVTAPSSYASTTRMPEPYHYTSEELAPPDLETSRLHKKQSDSYINSTASVSNQYSSHSSRLHQSKIPLQSSSHPHQHHSHSHSHSPSNKHLSTDHHLNKLIKPHHSSSHQHEKVSHSHSPSPSRRHHHHSKPSQSPSPHHHHHHHPAHSHSRSPGRHHHHTQQSPKPTRPSQPPSAVPRPPSSASRPRPPSGAGAARPSAAYDDPPHEHHPPRPASPESCKFAYSRCTGRKKAVCIGINYTGQSHPLSGCINDALNVYKFLLQSGYHRDNIFVLTDRSNKDPGSLPTRENILKAMRWLVQDARPHDSLFIHYSGHGGQTPDLDGDEDDGFDEVIFPLDYKKNGHITDDVMHDIMVRDLPQYVRLTGLFDACHSGTALGELDNPLPLTIRNRPVPAIGCALDLPYIYSPHGRLRKIGIKKKKTSRADVISWSGCRDDEKSYDTFLDGQAVGAMSHAFIEVLKAQPVQSYLDLLKSIRRILRGKYDQKPQLGSSHHIDTNLRFVF